ncbi:hypothetical protein PMI38_04967, partial [Pseudomonas sp. GM84]
MCSCYWPYRRQAGSYRYGGVSVGAG